MEDGGIEQTTLHLWRTAYSLSTTCPAVSRYYMSTLSGHLGNHALSQTFKKPYMYCKYCGSLWRHLNHKIQIQPIPTPNQHIKKLIKLEKDQPWKLNNRQKKKLKKYRGSTNKIIYTCNVCKKKTTFPGLKKYSAKEQGTTINTPAPKIKLKKGDLNAGLFISAPIEKNIQSKLVEDVPDNEISSQASLAPKLMEDSSNLNTGPQKTEKTHFTSKVMKKNVAQQVTSSSKKKKKGLLAKILNQEQVERQKKTLSSFLTSV